MPSNVVKINGGDDGKLTWIVGDSKMPKLIKYLNRIGENEDLEKTYQALLEESRRFVTSKGLKPRC